MRAVVSPDGTIEYIGAGELEFDGAYIVTVRRASHIEPVNFMVRCVFHMLRRRFGYAGRVAAITRRLPVLWRVNLSPSNGPTFGRFISRDEAIAAEVEWLERFRLGGNNGEVV